MGLELSVFPLDLGESSVDPHNPVRVSALLKTALAIELVHLASRASGLIANVEDALLLWAITERSNL